METELNEKLQDTHEKLMQAGVDRKESERDARLKETFSTLQRLFPGVRGRVVDLCKPTQRKYETAVSVILGRNIDAVVVDQEKTAIECIEVCGKTRVFSQFSCVVVYAESTRGSSNLHSSRHYPS